VQFNAPPHIGKQSIRYNSREVRYSPFLFNGIRAASALPGILIPQILRAIADGSAGGCTTTSGTSALTMLESNITDQPIRYNSVASANNANSSSHKSSSGSGALLWPHSGHSPTFTCRQVVRRSYARCSSAVFLYAIFVHARLSYTSRSRHRRRSVHIRNPRYGIDQIVVAPKREHLKFLNKPQRQIIPPTHTSRPRQ